MALSTLENVQGWFTLIFVVISVILGIVISLKYFSTKNKQMILIGLTWIGLVSPYFADTISFIVINFFGGSALPDVPYFFLSNFFLPFVHITWLYFIADFLYKEHKKSIIIIVLIESIAFEIIFLYLLIFDPSTLGTRVSTFYVNWELIVLLYLLLSIALFLITGILFSRVCFKSTSKEINLKGYILIIAYLSFTVGVSLDVIFSPPLQTELTLAISRIILTTAAIEFYLGFTMPMWLKNMLLKK